MKVALTIIGILVASLTVHAEQKEDVERTVYECRPYITVHDSGTPVRIERTDVRAYSLEYTHEDGFLIVGVGRVAVEKVPTTRKAYVALFQNKSLGITMELFATELTSQNPAYKNKPSYRGIISTPINTAELVCYEVNEPL
jgi:hypothetical protein